MAALLLSTQDTGELPGGSAVADWEPLLLLLVIVVAIVVALVALGRPGDHPSRIARAALRMPNKLARLTGMPPWAATAWAGTMGGLIIAAYGFFTDVAYHVAYGRDDTLFTAPHTAIFVGICLIAASAAAGIAVATLTSAPTGTRLSGLRVPWSLVPLTILGTAAVLGFPVDELWHSEYGVDVTMWSAPHMLMILGAALSSIAAWLVLGEAGVDPRASRRSTALHAFTAMTVVVALLAPLGEFDFGVPQFQQLYHPTLVMIASASLVAIRLVLGRGWTLGVIAMAWVVGHLDIALLAGDAPVNTREPAILLGSALAVEAVAQVAGTRRPVRYALLAGGAIGTVGLATEWWWNTGAWQPWTSALLPDVLLVAIPAALAGSVIAVAFSGAVLRRRGLVPAGAVAIALVVIGIAIVVPFPRTVGEAAADVSLEDAGDGMVTVHARLDPPDAAADARWFFASAWQGGGNTVAYMQPVGEGRYVSEGPIEAHGAWKSLLRLHRGSEMMAIPIRMPADPEFDLEAIPAQDRSQAFEAETRYLLRETTDGPAGLAIAVRALFAVLAIAWLSATVTACRRISSAGRSAQARVTASTIPGPGGA